MKSRIWIITLALLSVYMLRAETGLNNDKTGENINWQVISSGGVEGTSVNFISNGTVGQTAAGGGVSTTYKLYSGFWQDFIAGECDCIPGDADGSGDYNMLDILHLIAYLYKGGPTPIQYVICSGDPDCSCGNDMLDILYLIAYLYKGGVAPCTCEEWLVACGPPLRK